MLIVGRGESYKQIDFIKNFDGKIIACDSVANELIDWGVMPDYISWLETSDASAEWIILKSKYPFFRERLYLLYYFR